MDPLSALTAVLSLTAAIKTWIDNNNKKNDCVRDLSTSVNLVHTILSPLQDEAKAKHLDPSVGAALLGIAEVLSRIKDHLSLWKDKRMSANKILGFLNPSSVIDDLRDDARLLSQHLLTTSFALQVANFLAECNKIEGPLSKSHARNKIKNAEVADFWRVMVGENTLSISGKTFCQAISKWLGIDISESFRSALLLRIDEFAIGGVTPSSIDRFVGNMTLNEAINDLKKRSRASRASSQLSHAGRNVDPPLLVWIDDNPDNNDNATAFAEYMGVTVFILTSTASAKAWIDANEEHLRRRDDNCQLRFITDNARWESHSSQGRPKLDLSAGEAILRFLRGRQYKAPVLVCTNKSLPSTSLHRLLSIHSGSRQGWERFDASHGIAASSIDKFVGSRTPNEAIDDRKKKSRASSQLSHAGQNVGQPWLVWIDDNPENNSDQVAFAEYMGVTVFTLMSTASAKAWIDANEEHLRRGDDDCQLRFITDNARWESHSSQGRPKLDLSAGEAILRFLRGRQYKAPVLVCTNKSLPSTSYVLEYERCGSTTSNIVCLAYIASLAYAVDHDRRWEKFGAWHGTRA